MRKSLQWLMGTGLVATLAGLLLGSTAFAADPPGLTAGALPPGNPAPLTINYVGVHQTKSGTDGLIIKVSNLVVPTSDSPSDTLEFDLENAPGFGIQSNFTVSVSPGSPNYGTWFVPLNVKKGTPLANLNLGSVNLAASEWLPPKLQSPGVNAELALGVVTLPPKLPYGQLPEVPWAAGLPLVAFGSGALWWRRMTRVRMV
ncbi:hypothetical protein [Sulfobacillus thermosulfidooxidans]|uniref:hypothetical protein n=1 Tax=Sulfobacillus thermosulfidooxidans TaxID=28034 RepID=UPI00048AD73C|nr:hypothetical protein [Sulfobacillus thermosulfidooxidans]